MVLCIPCKLQARFIKDSSNNTKLRSCQIFFPFSVHVAICVEEKINPNEYDKLRGRGLAVCPQLRFWTGTSITCNGKAEKTEFRVNTIYIHRCTSLGRKATSLKLAEPTTRFYNNLSYIHRAFQRPRLKC